MPLVQAMARNIGKRQPPWIDRKDLISAGYIGLMKAAHRYRPSTHVPFDAFARKLIFGAIMDSLRRKNFHNNSMFQLFPEHAEHQACFPISDLEAEMDGHTVQSAVHEAVQRMPEGPRKKVIEFRYTGRGMNGKQAGEKLGIKESASCHLHKQAITEFKRVVEMSPDRDLLRRAA